MFYHKAAWCVFFPSWYDGFKAHFHDSLEEPPRSWHSRVSWPGTGLAELWLPIQHLLVRSTKTLWLPVRHPFAITRLSSLYRYCLHIIHFSWALCFNGSGIILLFTSKRSVTIVMKLSCQGRESLFLNWGDSFFSPHFFQVQCVEWWRNSFHQRLRESTFVFSLGIDCYKPRVR